MTDQQESERLERLRQVPLFADLGERSLKLLLERTNEFEVAAGHVLVERNQPGTGLFIVEEGTVEVETSDRTIELGPGEFFGELALLYDGALHSARVRAAGPVRCLAIHRDDFETMLTSEPKMALSMLRVLARRLAAAARH